MATVNVLKRVYPGRSWIVAGCGVLLGLLAWSVFTLDFRYALAIYGGLFALAVLAASLRHIEENAIHQSASLPRQGDNAERLQIVPA